MTPTLLVRNMAEHELTIESLHLLGVQVEQARKGQGQPQNHPDRPSSPSHVEFDNHPSLPIGNAGTIHRDIAKHEMNYAETASEF
jgi:hypothetical protein